MIHINHTQVKTCTFLFPSTVNVSSVKLLTFRSSRNATTDKLCCCLAKTTAMPPNLANKRIWRLHNVDLKVGILQELANNTTCNQMPVSSAANLYCRQVQCHRVMGYSWMRAHTPMKILFIFPCKRIHNARPPIQSHCHYVYRNVTELRKQHNWTCLKKLNLNQTHASLFLTRAIKFLNAEQFSLERKDIIFLFRITFLTLVKLRTITLRS